MNTTKIAKCAVLASSLLAMLTMAAPGRAQSSGSDMGQDQAQSQAAPAQTEDKHMREFAGLNLTDEQKTQIKQIRTDSRSQMEAVKADTSLAADAKQAKIREIRKGSHQQMLKVLTPEQRKQMKQNMHEQRSERQQPAQPPAAPQQ